MTIFKYFRKGCLLLVLLLWGVNAHSQEKVTGIVLGLAVDGTEEPLPGANVHWLNTTTGTITGTDGSFGLELVETTDQLVISYTGYSPDTVKAVPGKEMKILLHQGQHLKAAEIEESVNATRLSYFDVRQTQVMSEQELFKAACCNLSESFETNPSVDVSYSDAVTGTRQIQMLGLAGPYSQVMQEQMPGVRGLQQYQGMSFVPGSWISSIHVGKGTGSVVHGFESIAGQINVELRQPSDPDRLFLNGYGNQDGRGEFNLITTQRISPKTATTTLLHASARPFTIDGNSDGFADNPTGEQFNAINRWKFHGNKGWEGQFGVRGFYDNKIAGQVTFDPERDEGTLNAYGVGITSRQGGLWAKTGKVFSANPFKSVGFQFSLNHFDQDAYYGLREYTAQQQSIYANVIYQNIISSSDHLIRGGVSFMGDRYEEQLISPTQDSVQFDRNELIPGAFAEYTWSRDVQTSVVAGLRADYHNLFGLFLTPRLHARYAITEQTVLRLSGGKGWRVSNPVAENQSVLATSRELYFLPSNEMEAWNLEPEEAWNAGISLSRDFRFNYQNGTVVLDYYYTYFTNQVIMDLDADVRKAIFYNLDGKSFSHSLQAQIDYELVKNLDLRLAYRWLDVKTAYRWNGLLDKPLISNHRAFANLAYETKNRWKFDYTVKWDGSKRIPSTEDNPAAYQRSSESPDFFTMNAQVTKTFSKKFDAYLGMENITNFRQESPIIAADQPFSPYFDSSLIWGPVFGRMTYVGFRLRLPHPEMADGNKP
ncbi:MAG: carboxypeptidase-like regulatory domain-containing protein [Bacteroidia bacterium]